LGNLADSRFDERWVISFFWFLSIAGEHWRVFSITMHNGGAWSNHNKGMKGKRSLVAMYGKQGVLVGPGIFSAFHFLFSFVGREEIDG
jgi:hypothetical protein